MASRPGPRRALAVVAVSLAAASLLLPVAPASAGGLTPTGVSLSFSAPFDQSDLYVADSGNNRIVKVAPDGTSTTFLDGLNNPFGVTVGPDGSVYVGDTNDGQVVKVAPDGTQSTVGSGFFGPFGVAVDQSGAVYVADPYVGQVDKVTASGTQTVFASGLSFPAGVAVDPAGDVYIVETGANTVDKIAPDGTRSTIGSGLNGPAAVTVDQSGNAYIADTRNNQVVKVTPTGVQSSLWNMSGPNGVAVGSDGVVYFPDTSSGQVSRLDPYSTTVAGGFSNPSNIALGPRTPHPMVGENLTMNATVLAAPDTGTIATGNVTFFDGSTALGTIALDSSGHSALSLTTLPLGAHQLHASYEGDANNLSSSGRGVEVDVVARTTAVSLTAQNSNQNIYYSDPDNDRVVELAPDGTQTYLPIPPSLSAADPGPLAVDSRGNVYVLVSALYDAEGRQVWDVVRFRPNGSSAIVYQQQPPPLPGGNPIDTIAVDQQDNVYFPDHRTLVRMAPDGTTSVMPMSYRGRIEGLALDPTGDLYFYGSGDGVYRVRPDGSTSLFWQATELSDDPSGLAVDSRGDVAIADNYGQQVLLVAPDGSATVIADYHEVANPSQVAFDSSGAIYVADYARVQRFTAPHVSTLVVPWAQGGGVAISSAVVQGGHGDPVTLVAHVRAAPETHSSPPGAVTFADGSVVLGTAPIQPGYEYAPVAGLIVDGLSVGTHHITATYNGDSNDLMSTSQQLTVVVTRSRSGTTLLTQPVAGTTVYSLNDNTVYKINPNGRSATFFLDPNPPATDLAVGRTGKLFLAELNRVLVIGANKKATVLASGFYDLHSIEVDPAGNAYVVDAVDATRQNYRIVRIAPDGTETVFGQGVVGAGAVTLDAAGDMYATAPELPNQFDDFFVPNRFVEIKPDGTVIGLAPQGVPNSVSGAAVAANGDLYLTDIGTDQVVRYTPQGVVTNVGSFQAPNVTVDRANNLYVGDWNTNQLIRISPNGTQKVLLSGKGGPQDSGSYIPATSVAHGATVTLTATVIAAPNDGFVPTGTVTFMDGSTTLATVPVTSAGWARITSTTLATGTHTITAHYSGDASTAASVSVAGTVTVT